MCQGMFSKRILYKLIHSHNYVQHYQWSRIFDIEFIASSMAQHMLFVPGEPRQWVSTGQTLSVKNH